MIDIIGNLSIFDLQNPVRRRCIDLAVLENLSGEVVGGGMTQNPAIHLQDVNFFWTEYNNARENSWHFMTTPLVFLWNDFWAKTSEIPYWWHITTQIWLVLLIGWSKFLS